MYFYKKGHSWWSRAVERSICDSVIQNDDSSGPEQWRIRTGSSCHLTCVVTKQSSLMQLVRLGWFIDSDKVRHLAVGFLWVQHHVRSEKVRVSKMLSGLENPSDAQTKYLGPEPSLRHTKACNWVPVD